MYQNLKKRTEGFTIIEVLIVLAIAGLIMLIVFLAVPALQRNSRNNGRRNDIGRIGGQVNEFITNNNGQAITANAGQMILIDSMNKAGNLAQYEVAATQASAQGAQGVMGSQNGVYRLRLVVGAACGTAGATVAGSSRQNAIQYQLETSNASAHTNVCQDV